MSEARARNTATNTEQKFITARARTTDPATSHEAAKKVTNTLRVQNIILSILWARGPLTDPQIAEYYYNRVADGSAPNASESGLRTRRAELVKKGLVHPTSRRKKLDTGRTATVWTGEQKA